jgi:hypothetical protein
VSADLCDFELQVLRMLAGRGPSIPWGAALGAALEFLTGNGFATQREGVWVATERGIQRLDAEAALGGCR